MISAKKPIVVVGSINVDFVTTTERIPIIGETVTGDDFQLHFGGKGANQAVAVARLDYPVEMIGMVGSDIFGAQARNALAEAGVGVEAVETVEGSTGVAAITVSRAGENVIVVTPGANGRVSPEYVARHERRIASAGMVLAQLEIPLETIAYLSSVCRVHNVPLVLDPAPAQVLPREILSGVSWFTPNEKEAEFYAHQIGATLPLSDSKLIANAFLELGVKSVILKMGSRGALIASAGGSQLISAMPVKAIDSTAAGDAFNGAFATGLMLAMTPLDAARFACAAAGISVTKHGAQSSLPSLNEVTSLLKLRT